MQWTDALVEDFARFAAAFETDGFVASTAHEPEEIEPGVMTMPWWEYSDVVSEWQQALCEHGVIDAQSDDLSAEFVARMSEFEADPSLIGDADLQTIRMVLTRISRGERFCDGYMATMFENGVARAATRRLVELATLQSSPRREDRHEEDRMRTSSFRTNAEDAQKRYRATQDIERGSVTVTRGTGADRRRSTIELEYLIKQSRENESKNFLTDAAYRAACERADFDDDRRPKSKGVSYERTFFNMLSSQAMCFNIFGTLQKTPGGLDVLSACLRDLMPPVDEVTSLELEHAPVGNPFNDQGAYGVDCDVYMEFADADGRRGVIAMETKFVEREFSVCGHRKSKARNVCPAGTTGRDCVYKTTNKFTYWEASDAVGNLRPGAIGAPCPFGDDKWQLWTNHTLAHQERDRIGGSGAAIYAVCAPRANDILLKAHESSGMSSLEEYKSIVAEPETVRTLWVEDLLDALGHHTPPQFPQREDWLDGLAARYGEL